MSRTGALLAYIGLGLRPRMCKPADIPEYAEARAALNAGDFARVEQFLRQKRPWGQRHDLVDALTDWPGRPGIFDEWLRRRRSGEALLVSGVQRVAWAWEARGGGRANTVLEDGWRLFFERLTEAQKELLAAAEQLETDPTPWTWLITCARGLELSTEKSREYFDQAIARDPRSYEAHSMLLQNLCAKWGGSAEEMFAHARAASGVERPGGPLHALIATAHFEHAIQEFEDDPPSYLSRREVRAEIVDAAGWMLRDNTTPDDFRTIVALNMFAFVLSHAGEPRIANAIFERLAGRMTEIWDWFGDATATYRNAQTGAAFGRKGSAAPPLPSIPSTWRRIRRILSRTAAVLSVLLGLWLLAQRLGPTRPFPTESPLARLDREWENRSDNARPHYARACDAMTATELPWRDHVGRYRQPVPPEIIEWARANEPVIEHLRRAVAMPACYLRPPGATGSQSPKDDLLRRMRDPALFLGLRARLAADARDLATLQDSVLLLGGIARHLFSHPVITAQLYGIATAALQTDWLLVPLEWPDLSDAARRAYLDAVKDAQPDPPPLTAAWETDRDEMLWQVGEVRGGLITTFLGQDRIAAEFDRVYEPSLALAAAPVEQQVDAGSDVAARLIAQESNHPGVMWLYNAPRWIASVSMPSTRYAAALRARLIAAQRGNSAVLAVHRHREGGQWPVSLALIKPPPPNDPFSNSPFIYTRNGDAWTLRSVAADRDDDAGKHDHRFGVRPWPKEGGPPPPSDGDYVLWPIQWADKKLKVE